jgi:prophage regulatory protein
MIPSNTTFGWLEPTVILGRAEVLRRTGLKKSTMYALIRVGKFPRQVHKTESTVGWLEAEVENWIREREALRADPKVNKITTPSKPNAASAISERRAGAAQPTIVPIRGESPILTERLVKRLTGLELAQMRTTGAKPFYDQVTGRLWVCVFQADTTHSSDADHE